MGNIVGMSQKSVRSNNGPLWLCVEEMREIKVERTISLKMFFSFTLMFVA
jgi:hypothetical protein